MDRIRIKELEKQFPDRRFKIEAVNEMKSNVTVIPGQNISPTGCVTLTQIFAITDNQGNIYDKSTDLLGGEEK